MKSMLLDGGLSFCDICESLDIFYHPSLSKSTVASLSFGTHRAFMKSWKADLTYKVIAFPKLETFPFI